MFMLGMELSPEVLLTLGRRRHLSSGQRDTGGRVRNLALSFSANSPRAAPVPRLIAVSRASGHVVSCARARARNFVASRTISIFSVSQWPRARAPRILVRQKNVSFFQSGVAREHARGEERAPFLRTAETFGARALLAFQMPRKKRRALRCRGTAVARLIDRRAVATLRARRLQFSECVRARGVDFAVWNGPRDAPKKIQRSFQLPRPGRSPSFTSVGAIWRNINDLFLRTVNCARSALSSLDVICALPSP